MSYSWVEESIEKIPRRIYLLNCKFDFNNISYTITVDKIKSHNKLNICYGKLIGSDGSDKQIVIKMYEQSNSQFDQDTFTNLLDEIELHGKIEEKIGYLSYSSHMLFFFATEQNIGIIFDNLGSQLDKINLNIFNFVTKKQMILQLLQQINFLQINDIFHGDIKPQNICVSLDGKLSLVDFGISYCKSYFDNKETFYNTTWTSGSPEYGLIYCKQKAGDPYPKELFDKSQHFALAGLIFGILLNDPDIYFSKSLQLVNMLKSPNENLEILNLERRFRYFNEKFSLEIKQFIESKIPEQHSEFTPILLNMFEFNYELRSSLDTIIKQIELISK